MARSHIAVAQIGIIGFDGQIELEALRLFGLPEAAPAVLYACPAVPVGTREFQAETMLDLPNLAPGATHLVDVTVTGCRQGNLDQQYDLNDAWNISPSVIFDLDPAKLSVGEGGMNLRSMRAVRHPTKARERSGQRVPKIRG